VVFEKGAMVETGNFASLSRDPTSRFGAMYAMQAI
jgi:ABC-type multidrug transport system fused ATPase/permease subunit